MGQALFTQLRRLGPSWPTIVSGILLWLCTPRFSWGWALVPFAYVPFLWGIARERGLSGGLRQALWLQFFCSLSWYNWFQTAAEDIWQKDPLWVWVIYLFLCPFALSGVSFSVMANFLIRGRLPGIVLPSLFASAVFTTFDEVFNYMYLGLGSYFAGAPELLGAASIGGIPLLTYIAFLTANLVAGILHLKVSTVRKMAWILGGIGVLGGILLLMPRSVHPDKNSPRLEVNVIQTNTSRVETTQNLVDAAVRTYAGPWRALALLEQAGRDYPGAHLTVLPETLFSYYFFAPDSPESERLVKKFLGIVARNDGHYFFGALRKNENGEVENVMIHLQSRAGKMNYQSYPKRYLMPFGESLPGSEHFPWLKDLFFAPFLRERPIIPYTLSIDGITVGALVCNEIFHPLIVGLGEGVELNVLIGNETWVTGTFGQDILLAYAASRSVQSGIPLLKVSNTGRSALIDARGEFQYLSNAGVEDVRRLSIPVSKVRPTLSVSHPYWFLYLLWGMIGLTAALVWYFPRREQ